MPNGEYLSNLLHFLEKVLIVPIFSITELLTFEELVNKIKKNLKFSTNKLKKLAHTTYFIKSTF